MSQNARWALLLGVCAVTLGFVMQAPQWMHMADPRWQGVPVLLNADEHVYQARVQEGLSGRAEQASEAITGDSAIQGAQIGQIEAVEGWLFQWTGLSAPWLFQLLDSVVPMLLCITIWFFLLACGFTRAQALCGAMLFCVLQLYNLNRPVYQRESFLLMLLTFLLIIRGMRGKTWSGIAGGVLLGATVGGYFWGWTYAWAWAGVLLLCVFLERSWTEAKRLAGSLAVGVAAAVPGVWRMLSLTQHPLYAETEFRSGIHPSRLPESLPYSALFLVMAGGVLWFAFRHREAFGRHRAAGITVIVSAAVIHQQFVHGLTFNYVSHYLFAMVFSAIVVLLLLWSNRSHRMILAAPALAAAVYLAAIGYDGRYVLAQWIPAETDYTEQHYATLLPVLEELPRTRILSDPESSLFLAGATKHDVVYTLYLKNVLISHMELADRFCATQLPIPPKDRHLEQRAHLLWPDANGAFGKAARQEELRLASERCAVMDSNPAAVLGRFGVRYILWDEARQPVWDLARLGVPIAKTASGSGWSLWSL